MLSLSHVVRSMSALSTFLDSQEVRTNAIRAKSILVQLFSASQDWDHLDNVIQMIDKRLPAAVIVGATTMGEIEAGCLLTGSTVLSVSFFAESRVAAVTSGCAPGGEQTAGRRLGIRIEACGENIAAVLLLATPHSLQMTSFLQAMVEEEANYPVFGGGAANYELGSSATAFVFSGHEVLRAGAVAVVFQGEKLQFNVCTRLGWQPLSKRMVVTEAEGALVKKIDGQPAFSVYQRYLETKDACNVLHDALEFPLLFDKKNYMVARIPIAVEEEGAMRFIADIQVGAKFRIGYGDPALIAEEAKNAQQQMLDFSPDAIFLYNCGSRRVWLQDDVNLETQPFEDVAHTVGFYTACEFSGDGGDIQLLNSNMVVVGVREEETNLKPKRRAALMSDDSLKALESSCGYADKKHLRIVSRLVHFIGTVTAELEQANQLLAKLAETDALTQLYNRLKLDMLLHQELLRAQRYREALSVIMLDIDKFKELNDSFGHLAGDAALIHVADILRDNTRGTDYVGRWGGEEFLVICPHTNLEQAVCVAEKLRLAFQNASYEGFGSVTCSFGVTEFHSEDSRFSLLARADAAMYKAKAWGRNQVMTESLD